MSIEDLYMERGVQTEDVLVSVNRVVVEVDGEDASGGADTSVSSVSSLIIHTRPPTPTEVPSDAVVIDEDASLSIETKTRVIKHPQLTFLRPAAAGAQTLKTVSARIVSLPETVPKFSEKQNTSGRRVVSMPERGRSPLSSPQTLSPYMDQGSFTADTESPARVRVHSVATDLPHTPSPPSSPDSVVFIANKSPLPEHFLRKKVLVNQSRTPEPREEDWSGWAKSPPRPIPALHGPLSLPYARCPSGAEGTVIEEQEELPRVIWGLEASNSTKENKEPAEEERPDSRPPLPQAARKQGNKQKATSTVPPKFTGAKERTEAEAPQRLPAVQSHLLTPESDQYLTPPQVPLNFDGTVQSYMHLPARGPIDLSELMRPRLEEVNPYLQNADFTANAAFGSMSSGLSNYSSTGDLGLDWAAFGKPQDYLQNSLSGSIWSFPGNSFGNYSATSGFSPSPSMRSLLSSRSPIVLDPPGQFPQSRLAQHSPLSSQHTSSTLNTPALSTQGGSQRAMSALEIAQKYRQQQIQQKQAQSMLPTPPNSTSPLWSSGFSPYQDSLLSPEFLAAARMPNSAKDLTSQQSAFLHQVEVLQQLRSADHARLGVSGRNAQAQIPFLAPAARIQDHISDAFDMPRANNTSNATSYGGVPLNSQQPRNIAPRFATAAQARPSPVGFQPPNPSNAPIGTRRPGSAGAGMASAQGAAPLNPPSIQQRGSISQQNPRSVPLARLVQRRLSAVPEEDTSMLSDNGRSQPQRNLANPSVVYHTPAPPTYAELTAPSRPHQAPDEASGAKQPRRRQTPNPPAQPRKSATGGQQPHRQSREDKGPVAGHSGQPEGRGGNTTRSSSVDSIVSQRTDPPQGSKRGGFRGRGRGWRGRRANAGVHGPERVDGGLTVRS
ncbi:hypothetical protein PsYK624_083610 [Phanerochaete sordida]|uniref:Uncharacterized protein n=1 Tax=Phanerochaete sordida TaxID=48140 RepID=A0A9P3GA39_9APHY|nr:hypothetical protein PsYK624_083610 [Phanerochaete sordida]